MNKKWRQLRNEIEPKFEQQGNTIVLSGDVVDNDWGFEEFDITPDRVQKALDNIDGDVIIRLNSGGGDVFAGIEIYNAFKAHHSKVTVEVTGLAASAASLIAMGADEIVMCKGSMMMVHEAWTLAYGNKSDLMKTVELMDKIDASIVDIYDERVDLGKDFISEMLQDETWMTASEAVANGFADKVQENVKTQATGLDEYKNTIAKLQEEIEMLKNKKQKQNAAQKLFNKEIV